MKRIAFVLLLLAAFACTQRPTPVAEQPQSSTDPIDRPSIQILYVAVPWMQVYAKPAPDAQITDKYGLGEAIPILAKNGDWLEIRTFSGTGWVKSSDLTTGQQIGAFTDNSTPKFYLAPVKVEARVLGEITYQAKVNTDGDVVEVKVINNTTGNPKLAEANGQALMVAKFYPMVEKGQRKAFTYQHTVYY